MVGRLKGLSRARVAILCASEADVGLPTVKKILFGGVPVKSSQGRRVVKWANDHSYPIARPQAQTTDNAADSVEAALARAEALAVERHGR